MIRDPWQARLSAAQDDSARARHRAVAPDAADRWSRVFGLLCVAGRVLFSWLSYALQNLSENIV